MLIAREVGCPPAPFKSFSSVPWPTQGGATVIFVIVNVT